MRRGKKISVLMSLLLLVPAAVLAFDIAVLKGQVVNVQKEAVKGAEIYVYNSPDTRRPADFISAKTGRDGKFSIKLPAGKYWVVARLRKGEGYGPLGPEDKHSGDPAEIDIGMGDEFEQDFTVMNIREAAMVMKKSDADHFRITGDILDKNGTPLSDVYVFANRGMKLSKIPDFISAWTDETGRYTLYLPAGNYFIGYASVFPPDLENRILKELEVERELEGFDIRTDYIKETVGNDTNVER